MIRNVAVIGAGQMGGGIAQVAATVAKIPSVFLFDVQKAQLDHRMNFIGIAFMQISYIICRVDFE